MKFVGNAQILRPNDWLGIILFAFALRAYYLESEKTPDGEMTQKVAGSIEANDHANITGKVDEYSQSRLICDFWMGTKKRLREYVLLSTSLIIFVE